MVCRLCGAANTPQQTSCLACGSPLEETAGAPRRRIEQVGRAWLWPVLCASLGAVLGCSLALTLPAVPLNPLGILGGGLAGAVAALLLGVVPGRLVRVLGGSMRNSALRKAHRLCAAIIKQAEAALEAGEDRPEIRARLAAAYWFQGQRDRAEQTLQRAAQDPAAPSFIHHNLAVVHAAAGRPALALELFARAAEAPAPVRQWNEGLVRLALGQPEQAAAAFGAVFAAAAEDLLALHAQAVARAQTGALDAAKANLEEVVRKRPRALDARCDLGFVQHLQGWPDLARGLFADILRHQQAHLTARYNHGMGALLLADYPTALTDFQTLARFAPNHAWGVIQRAICHHRLGQTQPALEAMRRAVRLAPADFLVRYNAGTLLLRENMPERAVSELEKAYETAPQEVDIIINLGVAMHLTGHTRQAMDHFRAARRIAPHNAHARYNLVVTMAALGLMEEAEREVQELVQLYSGFAEAHHAIGVVWLLQNRLLEAIEQFRRVLDLMPRSAIARANLALAYYIQGDLAAAREQALTAIELESNIATGRDVAGHCALELGDKPGAIAHFQVLTTLEPTNPEAHSNLGLAYYKDDRLHEAIESYKRALVFNPKSPEGHTDLGLAYAKDRQLAEAAASLKQVVEWRPNNPIVRSNLGLVCYFKGDIEDAVEQWREVTRLSPRYARLREATRFSAYDDQEMYIRPIGVKARVLHLPPRLAAFRHSLQWAFDEKAYRLDLPWADLTRCARWLGSTQ